MTMKKFTANEAFLTFMALGKYGANNPRFADVVQTAQDKVMANTQWKSVGRPHLPKTGSLDVQRARVVEYYQDEFPEYKDTVLDCIEWGQHMAKFDEALMRLRPAALNAAARKELEDMISEIDPSWLKQLKRLFPDTNDLNHLRESVSRGRKKLREMS